jgi:hypothetical protein
MPNAGPGPNKLDKTQKAIQMLIKKQSISKEFGNKCPRLLLNWQTNQYIL